MITDTVDIMRRLGQSPIRAKKEINGFILNRLQYALIMEGWRLVEVCVVCGECVCVCVVCGSLWECVCVVCASALLEQKWL